MKKKTSYSTHSQSQSQVIKFFYQHIIQTKPNKQTNKVLRPTMTTITTSHPPSQEQPQEPQPQPQQEQPLTPPPTADFAVDDTCDVSVSVDDPDPTVAFRKTIAMNNAGVQLLDRDEPAKAAKVLTSAFYVFKKAYYKRKHQLPSMADYQGPSLIDKVQSILLNANATQQPRRPAASASASARSVSSSRSPSPSGGKTTSPDDQAEQSLDEETDPVSISIYRHPIHVPSDFDLLQETVGFLSTTITFNLALANHLYGVGLHEKLSIGQADPKMIRKDTTVMMHLQRAGRLYEYAIRLERARTHQNQEQQRRRRQDGYPPQQQLLVSPFVLMAILNNLGHLHTTLQNADQATKCYKQLQSTLMYMLQVGRRHHHPSSSSPRGATQQSQKQQHRDMIQFFLENASVGLQTTRLTAAAAA
jgi:hypothetical protein